MKTIALVTQKGGTGKSSLAVSLAVAAQEKGLRVYVIDLDPQGTAKNWFERREAETPEVATIDASQLKAALTALANQGYDLILLDTAGVNTPATVSAMEHADMCLIPARPSIADIEATRPTTASLTKLGKQFAFVLNQCPPGRSIRTNDAYRVLQLGGVVATASLATRTDHIDALALGQGVTERDPQGKAAREIRGLLQWILNKMEGAADGNKKARVA
ncbi:ParA family protein [Jiella sonneratiae]|uniref:ParA family protein n=1 Tax=Jiella sonneratiae TaxID=2816856 RepID=A0ABS3JC75_9HYPH|nr:ParA family protein [Jiella sonneratiae]MBO0906548.1 ParA family protein [Jiella sonneratiae]